MFFSEILAADSLHDKLPNSQVAINFFSIHNTKRLLHIHRKVHDNKWQLTLNHYCYGSFCNWTSDTLDLKMPENWRNLGKSDFSIQVKVACLEHLSRISCSKFPFASRFPWLWVNTLYRLCLLCTPCSAELVNEISNNNIQKHPWCKKARLIINQKHQLLLFSACN